MSSVLRKLQCFALVSVLALSACGKSDSPNKVAADAGSVGAESIDVKVETLLSKLTLEQKIAQMIQPEIKSVTPEDVRKYGLGSILNGGGSFPNGDKQASQQDWLNLADAFYEASIDTSLGNAGIPVIWGTDAVHGHNNVIGATLFPHNIGLGASGNVSLVADIARATALEVRATGIDWIFAPTVAVAKDARWGRTYESFGSNVGHVRQFAGPAVKAMQGAGVVATAKHFIGDGATRAGVDQGDAQLPLERLVAEHGGGYVDAIAEDVLTVMASFNSWNGRKAHGSKTLLTDVLRGQMGFNGFVVSDWNGIGQVAGCENDDCIQAIDAGVDMIMVPEDWESLFHNMVAQVKAGDLSEQRIDEAVRRILTVKYKIGLMDRGKPSVWAKAVGDVIGSAEHRAIARQAVRESMVLLKNKGNLLPLAPQGKYAVVGKAADDIGQQSGGWTITWQGTGNQNSDFPGATSILKGLREQVEAAGGAILIGDAAQEADDLSAAIVVFGETPYAEGQGDVLSLAWQQGHKEDLALINSFKARGVPVVAVFISGRPMWVNAELNAADAFVAAWLPGTEGQGVADVLLRSTEGSVQFDFVGRLSMPWPAADINASDVALPVSDYVFDVGYGLSAGDEDATEYPLNETPLGEVVNNDRPVFDGGVKAPWSLVIGDESNWYTPVQSASVASSNGGISLSSIDYQVQEDARAIAWQGEVPGAKQVYFQGDSAVDLTEMRAKDAALLINYRVNKKPSGAVTARMDCGWPCSGALDLTSVFADEERIGEWQQYAVPLQCFERAGTDLGKVNTPLLLVTEGDFALDFAEVVITERKTGAMTYNCDL